MLIRNVVPRLLLAANAATAAYVQSQFCEDMTGSADLGPASLSASVQQVAGGGQNLRLTVQLADLQDRCDGLSEGLTSNVSLDALAWSAARGAIPATFSCNHRYKTTYLEAVVEDHIDGLYPLSTFYAEARFFHRDLGRVGCVAGNITPELGPVASAALRWGPFSVLMIVLAAGIFMTVHGQRQALVEQARGEEDVEAPAARPLLPGVGDCLQYLQFVFLTGSLSVRYPGFYQPAVSKLEWFSLFARAPIARGGVYSGVSDGIYEINGTYGGTYGLELMHQIVGAPRTMDTWLNMILTLLSIAVGAAVVLECLRLWQRRAVTHVFRPAEASSHGLRHRLGRVLRVIFSYFTTPVVAISTYQFANAAWLPKYHLALAALLIVITAGSFIWLLCQVPTRNLGVLVFDSSKRYHLVHPDSPTGEQRHTQFVIVLFIVAFIRGVAVGGIQVLGAAQLAILGACELVLLAFVYGFRAYPTLSVNAMSCFVRLATLLLMVFFLPDVLAQKTKSAVGYAVLAMHGAVLLFGFLATACWDIWRGCRTWPATPDPDTLHLHHLRRHESTGPSPSTAHLAAPSIYDESVPGSPRSPYLHNVHAAESRASLYSVPVGDTDRYYRPPRARSLRTSLSVDLSSVKGSQGLSASATLTIASPQPTTRTASPLSNATSPYFSPMYGHSHDISAHHYSQPRHSSSESGSRSSSSLTSSPDPENGRIRVSQSDSDESRDLVHPLGPRWGDYSFRESDLFYTAPPQGAAVGEWGRNGRASPGLGPGQRDSSSSPVPGSTIRKVSSDIFSKLKRRDEEPAEKGFQVSRPPRTVPVEGERSTSGSSGGSGSGSRSPADSSSDDA
ncbi:integral membrane protein [Plectosphaerella cucumerina]|uniref:Integral membrane protein n=1 Tax=Plectosphaerella cucumerina TaxID=40658 RepID=A0A8K0TCY9_9PEZI|nr:integral membrane protein [Plectosphaerella cucumerina]